MHYAARWKATYTACGLYTYGIFINGRWYAHYELRLTRTKKKVTCKRCLNTHRFRGLK